MAAYNDKIALSYSTSSQKIGRRITHYNIANAVRDESILPLFSRLHKICEQINKLKVDAIFILEAGRSSMGHTWNDMAVMIEKETGLRYYGCKYINATAQPFGKALFYNPETIFVLSFEQFWISDTPTVPSGNYFGADIVTSKLAPVEDSKVIIDKSIHVGAVHCCPLDRDSRLKYCHAMAKMDLDLITGDFNTFSDDGGPEMLEILDAKYQELLPIDTTITFSGFPHDLLTVTEDRLHLHPYAEIVEKSQSGIKLRPQSWLDHSMINRFTMKSFVASATVADCDYSASDHAPIVTDIIFV